MSTSLPEQGGVLSRLLPPAGNPIPFSEKLRTAVLGGLAIGLTGYTSSRFIEGPALLVMLASMGASTVILFCVPSSPMARIWPATCGHLISGLIGIGCSHLTLDLWIKAGMAVGLSIFAMHLTRSLHPPGGASTLVATLSGNGQGVGLQFLLTPLALNVAILLALSALFNSRFLRRQPSPPVSTRKTDDRPPLERLGIRREDLHAALQAVNSFVDISENQLSELYDLAAASALQRELGNLSCGDIMSRDLITAEFGSELEEVWGLMQRHQIKVVPVIDRARHVIGIITLTDFFRHARIDQVAGLKGKVQSLIRRTPGVYSNKPEVAGQIMTHPVITLPETAPAADLARLITTRRVHQIPIVDARHKLVGLVTETDLIGGFYKSLKAGLVAAVSPGANP